MSRDDIVRLRELTGAGVMDCKKALAEAKGDFDEARGILRKKGLAAAQLKSGREVRDGQVISYVHAGGRIGVLVEINCETDFVARNDVFQRFARDVALQVAASPEDLPLLEQKFIKDPARTLGDCLTETIARLGENIRIRRYVRFELGRESSIENVA